MLGDAKQKLQRMIELAEELYTNVNDLKERVQETTETVEETNERVADLASEVRAQRVILEALADERDLEVELPPEYESVNDFSEIPADKGDTNSGEEPSEPADT